MANITVTQAVQMAQHLTRNGKPLEQAVQSFDVPSEFRRGLAGMAVPAQMTPAQLQEGMQRGALSPSGNMVLGTIRYNTGINYTNANDALRDLNTLNQAVRQPPFNGNYQMFQQAVTQAAQDPQIASQQFTPETLARISSPPAQAPAQAQAQAQAPAPAQAAPTARPPTAITDPEDKAVMDAYRDLATDPTNGTKIKVLQDALVATGHFNPAHSRTGATTQYLGPVTTDAMERFLDGQTEAVRDDAAKIAEQGLTRIGTATDAASNRAANHFLYTTDAYGEKEGRPDSRAVIHNEATNPARIAAKTKFDSEILPAVNTRMTPPAAPAETPAPAEVATTPTPAPAVDNRPVVILDLASYENNGKDRNDLAGLQQRLEAQDMRVITFQAGTPEQLRALAAANPTAIIASVRDDRRWFNNDEVGITRGDLPRQMRVTIDDANNPTRLDQAAREIKESAAMMGGSSQNIDAMISRFRGGDPEMRAGNGAGASATTPSPATPSGQNPNSANPAGQPATAPPYNMLMGQT